MWQDVHSFICYCPKCLGITGDSLTFVSSFLLALEAVFKPSAKISIERKKAIVKHFPYADNRDGTKLDAADVERKWSKMWVWVNRIGAFGLVVGFAFLLASRVLAE